MDYVKLGKSGLDVSRICLGGMAFGIDPGTGARGTHAWVISEDDSRTFIKQALESGINFIDTANVYSLGTSEEIIGRAVRDFANRDEVVLATKVHGAVGDGPNSAGLSRKHIMAEIDKSLKRLGTDYIDLYQIHRWDPNTPIEETMEALHDVVKAGKARYIGTSSMYAWQFAKAQFTADLHDWTRFISMQNHYNLLYREEEREMIPFCIDQGVALIPWSPLARGRLARGLGGDSVRAQTDGWDKKLYSDEDDLIAGAVGEIAEERGLASAQIALAWVMGRPGVTAPIVGATKAHHITDAIAALDIELSDEENERLERHYSPRAHTA